MNRFKFLFIILFLVLFTTGCDVTYNLEIMGNNYKENIVVPIVDKTIENYPVVAFYGVSGNLEDPQGYVEGIEYYEEDLDLDKENVSFSYMFFRNNFSRSNFANSCYKNFTILTDKETDNLIISTGRDFLCFENYEDLDNVVVKIKTNHKVISSNADSIKNDVYIWNINESNKDDAAISMVLSSDAVASELSFWEKHALFIIISSVFLIAGIIFVIMKKRSEKIDEI